MEQNKIKEAAEKSKSWEGEKSLAYHIDMVTSPGINISSRGYNAFVSALKEWGQSKFAEGANWALSQPLSPNTDTGELKGAAEKFGKSLQDKYSYAPKESVAVLCGHDGYLADYNAALLQKENIGCGQTLFDRVLAEVPEGIRQSVKQEFDTGELKEKIEQVLGIEGHPRGLTIVHNEGIVDKLLALFTSYKEEGDTWVKVSERLPELTEHTMWWDDETNQLEVLKENTHAIVWAYNEKLGHYKAKYDGRWYEVSSVSVSSINATPTHWQPLDNPPQNQQQ